MTSTKEATKKQKILVIDDHPIFREGISQLINEESDMEVIGKAQDGHEALDIIKKKCPDAVTLDMSLQGAHGLEVLKDLAAHCPEIPVLVVSMHDETIYAERALKSGAKGYIMKSEASEKVVDAIRQVIKNKIYLSDQMKDRMLEKQIRGVPQTEMSVSMLSDRELEVFELIGKGESTAKIAAQLHLSVKTIETYRANIKSKLGLEDNTELIKHAVQWVQAL